MWKLFLSWFLASYSVNNMIKLYDSYSHENTFSEMKEFIYHQQLREDRLREYCNLQLYVLPKPQTFYETIRDSYYSFVKKHLYITNTLVANTIHMFYELSSQPENKGSDILFDGTVYHLLREMRNDTIQSPPLWSIHLENHTLMVIDVQ